MGRSVTTMLGRGRDRGMMLTTLNQRNTPGKSRGNSGHHAEDEKSDVGTGGAGFEALYNPSPSSHQYGNDVAGNDDRKYDFMFSRETIVRGSNSSNNAGNRKPSPATGISPKPASHGAANTTLLRDYRSAASSSTERRFTASTRRLPSPAPS